VSNTLISMHWLINFISPNANVWIIGHSLGGALASLVGITFGLPVVAFESPGERLSSTRLHLPSPVSLAANTRGTAADRLSHRLTMSHMSTTQRTP
jgi:putative lipase involved disintegration of autophagic bodies